MATMSWYHKSEAQEVKLPRSKEIKQCPQPKQKQTIDQPETIYVAVFIHVTL